MTSASFAQSLLSQTSITMASQPDTSVQDHSLDAILAKMVPKYTRDGHDALFLVLHAFMISAGFRLVGLGDDGSIVSMCPCYLAPHRKQPNFLLGVRSLALQCLCVDTFSLSALHCLVVAS